MATAELCHYFRHSELKKPIKLPIVFQDWRGIILYLMVPALNSVGMSQSTPTEQGARIQHTDVGSCQNQQWPTPITSKQTSKKLNPPITLSLSLSLSMSGFIYLYIYIYMTSGVGFAISNFFLPHQLYLEQDYTIRTLHRVNAPIELVTHRVLFLVSPMWILYCF